MSDRKGLAMTALALGLLGLFTAGGLVVGSLVGLGLAALALATSRGGRDVAWAALAANVFALLTLLPIGVGLLAYRAERGAFAVDDDALPVPAQDPFANLQGAVPPPPPPPPPPAAADVARRPPVVSRSAASGTRTAGALPVRAGGRIEEPRKTRHVNPVYPAEALQARLQGVVVLECTISPTGKVVEVKVLRGVAPLSEAAVAAVKQWEYTPTVLDGVAVPVIMTVTVNFKLS